MLPTVLLVLNGGPNTLVTVLNAAYCATPIVILADTGGVATALYQYSEGLVNDIPSIFQSRRDQFEEIFKLDRL